MGSSSREVIELLSSSSEDGSGQSDFEMLDNESDDDEVQFVRVINNEAAGIDALLALRNGAPRREEDRAPSEKRELPPQTGHRGGGKKLAIHYPPGRGWTELQNQGLEFVLVSREHELDEAVTSLAKSQQDKPFSLKVGREYGVLKVLLQIHEGMC